MLNTMNVATPTDRQIVITRAFNAPRQMVWNAITKPELLRKWLFGPPGWEMTVCDENLRVGGEYRWAWRGPSGEEMAMRGVYREIAPPKPDGSGGRIVRTETFEFGCAPQAGEQVGTLELTEVPEHAGKTLMKLTLVYPSKEARDGAIASGMEHGMSAGYDRLEQMLTPAAA